MSEQLLTKCPHCGTTFRLTQQHLQIAGGAVRCGACYQVFHASEFIVKTAVVEEIVPAATTPRPDAGLDTPLPDPLADLDLDAVDGLDAYASADLELPASGNTDAGLADDYHSKLMEGGSDDNRKLSYDDDSAKPAASRPKKEVSEDWAKKLLEELGEDPDAEEDDDLPFAPRKPKEAATTPSNTQFSTIHSGDDIFAELAPVTAPPRSNMRVEQKPRKLEEELSDSFKNLGLKGFSDNPFSLEELELDDDKGHGDVDESWAKAILEELEDDKRGQTNGKEIDSLDFSLEADDDDDHLPFAARPVSRNREEALQKARGSQRRIEADTRSKPAPQRDTAPERSDFSDEFLEEFDEPALDLEDINLEDAVGALNDMERLPEEPPVKMSPADIAARVRAHAAQLAMEETPRRSPVSGILYGIGSLILIATLIAQIAYFKFDEFARWPELRPLYDKACEQLGCTLPAQTDTSKIRGDKLVVRTHPRTANALTVDFMLSNEADFAQPFPIVELSFEDINDKLVASRGFLPSEYIHDTAIDLKRMPPHTPFRINLEIVDPGPQAANYRLRYLPVPD